ncbi:MAG: hypothetical protein U0175_11115 [Caldilineaceae bacterium]
MNQTVFARAEEFIWKNARLLERVRFAYHFKGGSGEHVTTVLRAYQNADGGFGHALEPDIRCPESQPVPTQHALEFLDEVGFATGGNAQMVQSACDYLMTITTSEGGVPWLLPSAQKYPRAAWWNTNENPPASLNPTAAIAGLLHKNGVQHTWLDGATNYCWSKIAGLQAPEMHEMGAVLTFLYHTRDRQRAEVEIARLAELLFATGLVADAQDTSYVRKALDWAPTPQHPLRRYFSQEAIQANLETMLAQQQTDGGWNITWPAVSPSCEFEWRGWVTMEKLLILQSNGS